MADTPANRLRAAEEVLARMAEETPQLPLVQRVLAAIRSFLRPIFKALGVSLELTDAEIIRDYLTPARDYVRRGAKWQLAAGVPAFSRDVGGNASTIYDIGFTLPNGARYARVTRDATGERYDYFDTREAAEQAGPGRAPDRASARAAVQGAERVRAEGGGREREVAGLVVTALARRETEALATVEEVNRAAAEGRLAVDPARRNQCFARSAAASKDGLGSIVIGRVNGPGFRREWHAVVRLDDGAMYDPLDRHF